MWDGDCGCVPVTSDDGSNRVLGIITDRDLCMASYTNGSRLGEVRVEEVMSRELQSCGPDTSFAEAQALMAASGVRRLPVVDESGQILGLLSLADLAREAEREKNFKRKRITEAEVGGTMAAICRASR
jgi:CBS domain-containing protein